MAGQEVYGKAAMVNPKFHNTSNPGARESCITHGHQELARMEEVVARSKDTLNYSFLVLRAPSPFAACYLLPPLLDLKEQSFKAIRIILNYVSRDYTYLHPLQPAGLDEGGLPEAPQTLFLTGREGHPMKVSYFFSPYCLMRIDFKAHIYKTFIRGGPPLKPLDDKMVLQILGEDSVTITGLAGVMDIFLPSENENAEFERDGSATTALPTSSTAAPPAGAKTSTLLVDDEVPSQLQRDQWQIKIRQSETQRQTDN
ncbi:hypothetical protein E2C01_048889 [Portunus trituberculatus]|uniref:Uncharacterized protein n=1 Tax=Portunus trituberculatus TaxID=210409 RepID=A0A5B7GBC9_PORTR|nr:hypothetical protein [Portunus trituberculatus]